MIPKTNPKLSDALADCDLSGAKNLNQIDLLRRSNGGRGTSGNVSLESMKGSICALQTLVDNAGYSPSSATGVNWSRKYTGAVLLTSNVNTKDAQVTYSSSTDRITCRVGMTYTNLDQAISAMVYGYCDQPGTLEVNWTKENGGKGNFEIIGFATGYLKGASKQYKQENRIAEGDYSETFTLDPAYPYIMLIARAVVTTSDRDGTTSTCYYSAIRGKLT